jgi:alanine dehydrogenase
MPSVSSRLLQQYKPAEIVLLSGHDLRRLLTPKRVIEALREAYAALADNRGDQGRSVGFTIEGGSIHVKSGLLPGSHLAFASKVNVNLPDNWKLRQLPTIQGVVVVSDAKDGRPLAIMESITLTGIRTAATAALAAGYGARKYSKRTAIIGCGAQAKYQLEAIKAVFPLQTVRVFDIDGGRAEAFARANSTATCSATPAPSVREAVRDVDICITCTSSKSPVLTDDLDLRGCFVAAIGADNPEKQEIAPALMRRARILVDDIEACASGGDLNHALRARAISKDRVHSDLAELASGRKQGRMTEDELVIFDSSGSGVQDVAAAWIAYREASRADIGMRFDLVGPRKQSRHCLRALSRRVVTWWTQRRGLREDVHSVPNHLLADIGMSPDDLARERDAILNRIYSQTRE